MTPAPQSGPDPPHLQKPEVHCSPASQLVVQLPQWAWSDMGS